MIDFSHIPASIGVYLFLDKNKKIIYIGKSKNLKNRVKQYFINSSDNRLQIEFIKKKTVYIEFHTTSTEEEALLLEYNLIQKYKPQYNVKLKDSNKYPYICITKEQYPGIVFEWGNKKNMECFGPYTSITMVKYIINTLNSIYKLKKCKYKFPHKMCVEYEMDNCSGPCDSRISEKKYNNNIKYAKKILKGNYSSLINMLKEQMKNEAEKENFEKAAIIRDAVKLISKYSRNGIRTGMKKKNMDIIAISREKNTGVFCLLKLRDGVISDIFTRRFNVNKKINDNVVIKDILLEYYANASDKNIDCLISEIEPNENIENIINKKVKIKFEKFTMFEKKLLNIAKDNAVKELFVYLKKEFIPEKILELKEHLKLQKIPEIIIGADISHFSGKWTTGAIVNFKNGFPNKSGYRYYNIKTIKNNDYKALQIILKRYISKYKVDMILIDGGKGQLKAGKNILKELNKNIPVFALAKRFDTLFNDRGEIIVLSSRSKAIKLLKDIRDESHRFANKLRKKQMQK